MCIRWCIDPYRCVKSLSRAPFVNIFSSQIQTDCPSPPSLSATPISNVHFQIFTTRHFSSVCFPLKTKIPLVSPEILSNAVTPSRRTRNLNSCKSFHISSFELSILFICFSTSFLILFVHPNTVCRPDPPTHFFIETMT